MSPARCPTLIGRRSELADVRTALAAARIGRGSMTVLVGPAGIGKTRLVREAAAAATDWSIPVLTGRCVSAATSAAFRPLEEALLAGLRRLPDPDDSALRGFRPVLGQLIPQWREPGATPDSSLVVLAEAVLRLLSAVAGQQGVLLVLEDLHWADPATLAVVEYLADNLVEERVMVLITARDDPGPALALFRALAQRQVAVLDPLSPLTDDEIEHMATACLGEPPAVDLLRVLRRRTGGTPLLVEELLSAGIDYTAYVPATATELISTRLQSLAAPARRCVQAAAVLGSHFDWQLLAAIANTATADSLAAMRSATNAGLLDVDGHDGFRFHHALGRDAVLSTLLPAEQAELARHGLAVLTTADLASDETRLDLAIDLAVRAGDTLRAAGMAVEAGRRNLERGALASAAAVLQRGRELAAGHPITANIDDVLAEVLSQAGDTVGATATIGRLIAWLEHEPGSEKALARAHLRLARAHATAGDWHAADASIDAARRHQPDAELTLHLDVVAAQVALGDSRFGDADRLASAALKQAKTSTATDVTCDALLVLGRMARRTDMTHAEALFNAARAAAHADGLVVLESRALQELAICDVQESLRTDRLEHARARAEHLGNVAAVAVLDLQTIAVHNSRWEPDRSLQATKRCVTASRRYKLATLSKALVLGAAASDYLNNTEASEEAIAEALHLAPDDTHLRGEVWGIRGARALGAADDDRALQHLNRAMDQFGQRDNEVTGSPAIGLWTLLTTIHSTDLTGPPIPINPIANRWNRGLLRFAEAVALGRTGNHASALGAFDDADTVMRRPIAVEWHRLQARRLVAAAAITDGWGAPAAWAAEDLPLVEARDLDRWAAALKGIMRRAGAVVPRRGRGSTIVPAPLRSAGVTSREADVLLLVGEGCTNREIAARLVLSPRTVEKHVERLLAKTRRQNRIELVAYAARLFPP